MECKYNYGENLQDVGDKIKIETYWNVNHSANVTFSRRYTIKIETYWNVNICADNASKKSNGIKIETYWNVNFCECDLFIFHSSYLNRDILECKFLLQSRQHRLLRI